MDESIFFEYTMGGLFPSQDYYDEFIMAEYLKCCSPEVTYEHLKERSEKYFRNEWSVEQPDNTILEMYDETESFLLEKGYPLITLGLAKYGMNGDVLLNIYNSSNLSLKYAILMNRKFPLNDSIIENVIHSNNANQIIALLSYRFHRLQLEELYRKEGVFEKLDG